MAVALTLVQTKQIIYIYIYINETIQKNSTNNTKHSKYKYTYYQNTHTYTVVTSPVISSLKMAFLCQMRDLCSVAYKGEVERALSALNEEHRIIFMLESLVHPQNCTPLSTYWVNDDFAQSNFVL